MYHYDARDLADYLMKMKNCRQFDLIGVLPKWVPGTGDIDGFVHDEVVRQFHDPRKEHDGGVRVRGMRSAWEFARQQAEYGPDMNDLLSLGKYIEPGVNSAQGFRLHNVYIGDNIGAPPGLISQMINYLLLRVDDTAPLRGRQGPHAEEYRSLWRYSFDNDSILKKFAEFTRQIVTADDWYLCFQAIHPFGDGNGRTGKVLHNWLLGSLDEPVLVDDYFNSGNP